MNNNSELSFAIKRKIPRNAYRSSVKGKNIDRGVDIQEMKKIIAEQIKRNYSHNLTEGETDEEEEESEAEGQGEDLAEDRKEGEENSQSVENLDSEEEEKKSARNPIDAGVQGDR